MIPVISTPVSTQDTVINKITSASVLAPVQSSTVTARLITSISMSSTLSAHPFQTQGIYNITDNT